MVGFSTLNTAYTGLATQARRIDVIGENIANASTPGYRRRRVDLGAIEGPNGVGIYSGADRTGRGVEIRSIDRVLDPVLERHARAEAGRAADLKVGAEALSELESRWTSFGETGIAQGIRDLGAAFDELVNQPDDLAIRNITLQRAEGLATEITAAAGEGADVRSSLVQRTSTLVDRVNSISTSIAGLHTPIVAARAAGADGSSLEDRRDQLIDELTSITNASVLYGETGGVRIAVDGYSLVADDQTSAIGMTATPDPSLPTGMDRVAVTAAGGRELTFNGGDLAGTLRAANTLIPDQVRRLDQLATDLANSMNAIHAAGTGLDGGSGRNLFTIGSGAATFAVSTDVVGRPERLAVAGAAAGPLDTTTAEQLADLVDAPDGPAARWTALVADLAGITAANRTRADAAGDAASAAEQNRISVSGVSLDEEMTELISAQRSYEAAARVISAVDGMLDTLINRTGLVGR